MAIEDVLQIETISVAVFCPQSRAPQKAYLDLLQIFITQNPHLRSFVRDIIALEDAWALFANANHEIAGLTQGPRYMRMLADWITDAKSDAVASASSGILALPLLTIVQIAQYFQFLQAQSMRHVEFIAQVRNAGGIQGYCGGLPAAMAIACSRDEEELVKNAAVAMRIVLGVGAYGELGYDADVPGSTNMAVRLKKEGQGDELVRRFPGAHISAVTDPKTISIVGPVDVLTKLQAYAETQGFVTQNMHIRGKVHNPENADLARELCALCDKTPSLKLPTADSLQVPVRSNMSGDCLDSGSLTNEIVTTILASRCEWFTLLTKLAKDLALTRHQLHTLVGFGIGDCVPILPFHKEQVRLNKVSALSLIQQKEGSYAFQAESIAIVGASCRLPGASDLDELWDLIARGADQHRELPNTRFDLHSGFRALQAGRFASERKFYGNFLDDVDKFDSEFFGINRKEALNMDPQQRILLELSYEAMESSGYLSSHRRDSGDNVGCFIGGSLVEYLDNTNAHAPTAYTSTGTIRAFLSGRLSYYFGWTGPSEVIDSACSSSLVAINRACKAIQAKECFMALAGGVNIITGVNNYLDLGKAGFLSPTGQCKPFDEAADGYCRSDGAGLVVLKPLRDALQSGDHILGIIPGVATRNSGLSSSSITVPYAPSQKALYQEVLDQAGLKSHQVSYVEAHGTGTQAGDPIEIESIREVFGGQTRSTPLNIGSIKGNVGHSETAAGVAGLLKVLTMLQNKGIPPQASHKALNHKIPSLTPDNIKISARLESWDLKLRAACVNSYGAAGTNCALLCVQGPVREVKNEMHYANKHPDIKRPVVISAFSREGLMAFTRTLQSYVHRKSANLSIDDIAFTLNQRRPRHKYYARFLASSATELARALEVSQPPVFEMKNPSKPVILAFSGQSREYVGLDQRLYNDIPGFRKHVDACDDILRTMEYPSIFPGIFQTEPISDVVVLQSALFALQFACARSWLDAGLQASATIGHSFGELTALAISGVLSLNDTMRLVAARADLMQTMWGSEKGKMLVIFADLRAVERLISCVHEDIEIACYNAPNSHVIVGSTTAINRVEALTRDDIEFQSVQVQRLNTTYGFHSRLTEGILNELVSISQTLEWQKPVIPLETCTASQTEHWLPESPSRHARNPVYFADAVQRLEQRHGPAVWLEAGMNTPIVAMAKKALVSPHHHSFQSLTVKDTQPPAEAISSLVIDLWNSGVKCSLWDLWTAKAASPQQVWLPPYPFQRQSFWLENIDRTAEMMAKGRNTQVRMPISEPVQPKRLVTSCAPEQNEPSVSSEFKIHPDSVRFQKIVGGHSVRSRPLCPATMYMECVAMALQLLHKDKDITGIMFENIDFQAALGVDSERVILLTLREEVKNMSWAFVIESSSKLDPRRKSTIHAQGIVRTGNEIKHSALQRFALELLAQVENKKNAERLLSGRVYGLFNRVVHYDKFFHGMSQVTLDDKQSVAEIEVPTGQPGGEESLVLRQCDAVTLDIFIQVVGFLMNSHDMIPPGEVMVATGVEAVWISSACDFVSTKSWKVYSRFSSVNESNAIGDVFVFSKQNEPRATLIGCRFNKLPIARLEKILDSTKAKSSTEGLQARTSTTDLSGVPTLEKKIRVNSAVQEQKTGDVEPVITRKGALTDSADPDLAALKAILSTYTSLPVADIPDGAIIADMGVDSLAAVEMAEEFDSRFQKSLSSGEVLTSSLMSLAKLLVPEGVGHTHIAMRSEDGTGVIDIHNAPRAATQTSQSQERQDGLLKILSECSGIPKNQVNEQSTLAELGVDSLSMVEMADQIEEIFDVKVDGDSITAVSRVGELMSYLGIVSPRASTDANISSTQFTPESTPQSGLHTPSVASSRSSAPSLGEETPINGRHSCAPDVKDASPSCKLPVYTGTLAALAEAEACFSRVAVQRNYAEYWSTVSPIQNELLVAYIAEAFKTLAFDLSSMQPGEILPPLKHLPKYNKLVRRLFDILTDHEIVEKRGYGVVRGCRELSTRHSEEILSDLYALHESYRDEIDLMALTGPKLADCLAGKADAVAIMFGNAAALNIMENIYFRAPMFATLTEQLVNFLERLVSRSRSGSGAQIRILEVGAGFGGTTTRVAEALNAAGLPVDYTFTDISPRLVQKAKTKFAKYDWMTHRTFNLEEEVPPDMIGQFDIVIGTNCVHATTSKTASVKRIRKTLNMDGIVVLSEVTKIMDWYDITFGLLDGWWLAEGETAYALQPAAAWMMDFERAGYASCTYSKGPSLEENTQQLLVASKTSFPAEIRDREPEAANIKKDRPRFETMTYKDIDDTAILADVYMPSKTSRTTMSMALMIHGGGHMTLSRKAVRPAQTMHLLENNVLPVSIDYRLCPEINLIDGPMTDVRDAFAWMKTKLPNLLCHKGIIVDPHKVVVVGWSTGGHLAMTLAWTAPSIGLAPPAAVLSFYAPTDFSSGDLDVRRAEMLPERRMSLEKILKTLPSKAITSYDIGREDASGLGWVRPGDSRSELVLSLFKEASGLPLLLCGISIDDGACWLAKPSADRVAAIDPMAQLRAGQYGTPTFLVHGTVDQIVPFKSAVRFVETLRSCGVECGFLAVEGVGHIHDLKLKPNTSLWASQVGPGYDFLLEALKR